MLLNESESINTPTTIRIIMLNKNMKKYLKNISNQRVDGSALPIARCRNCPVLEIIRGFLFENTS